MGMDELILFYQRYLCACELARYGCMWAPLPLRRKSIGWHGKDISLVISTD